MDRLVGEVTQAFGRLDVLINDAAYNIAIPFGDLDSLTPEVWNRSWPPTLTGPMLLTKAVAPVMKSQGRGRVINIASVAGLSPNRLFYRLCRGEGRAHSSDALHGGGAGA